MAEPTRSERSLLYNNKSSRVGRGARGGVSGFPWAGCVGVDRAPPPRRHGREALRLSEAMRDTTFRGTLEYQQFAELCATIRRSVAR